MKHIPYKFVIGGLALAVILIGTGVYLGVSWKGQETQAHNIPATNNILLKPTGSQIYIFNKWSTWPKSGAQKAGDMIPQTLFLMGLPVGTDPGTWQDHTIMDINGDGLSDVLYHDLAVSSGTLSFFAILLNKGNMNFELVYKCAVYDSNEFDEYKEWTGDCAAI